MPTHNNDRTDTRPVADPAPTPAEIRRGKPWRWYIRHSNQYISVRFSSEQQRIIVCLDGQRWGYGAGGPSQHDLAVVAKSVRAQLWPRSSYPHEVRREARITRHYTPTQVRLLNERLARS